MLRRSLTKGFAEGIAAPLSFFAPLPLPAENYTVSLDHAWEKVGDAVRAALIERASLGKEFRQEPTVGKTRSSQAA